MSPRTTSKRKRDIYIAERIEKSRITITPNGAGLEYLIKWEGYPESENTWEPKAHILDKHLFEEFKELQALKRENRRKAKVAEIEGETTGSGENEFANPESTSSEAEGRSRTPTFSRGKAKVAETEGEDVGDTTQEKQWKSKVAGTEGEETGETARREKRQKSNEVETEREKAADTTGREKRRNSKVAETEGEETGGTTRLEKRRKSKVAESEAEETGDTTQREKRRNSKGVETEAEKTGDTRREKRRKSKEAETEGEKIAETKTKPSRQVEVATNQIRPKPGAEVRVLVSDSESSTPKFSQAHTLENLLKTNHIIIMPQRQGVVNGHEVDAVLGICGENFLVRRNDYVLEMMRRIHVKSANPEAVIKYYEGILRLHKPDDFPEGC